jgi:hypothetical protein
MADVAIGRLRVRGPSGLAARTAFLIEDGCRTAIPDSEKLILVRRLDLGRGRASRGEQATLLRRAYDRALLDSRHGGADGAESANCVWFASRAEARRLLLAALLAGREPSAWYWRLAVPEWRGRSAEEWLGALVEPALRGGGEPDLVEIVTLAVEAGAVEMLVRALAGSVAVSPGAAPAPKAVELLSSGAGAGSRFAAGAPDSGDAEIVRAVARLRARLAPQFAARIEDVARRIGPATRASFLLLERLLLASSPSLALSPALLRELVSAYAAEIALPARPTIPKAAERPAIPPSRAEAVARDAVAEAPPRPASLAQAEPDAARAEEPARAEEAARAEKAAAEPVSPPALAQEQESQAAGLWMVVPSLIRMGFREWLAERPETLSDDPGRTLLRFIARHHRVGERDPAFGPLAPADGEEEEAAPEWARLWRFGLDRWLRRRARMPLHDLVWRRGWLRMSEDRLLVRFPPGSADLRLRRRALDVDPGWTDWLGLVVLYTFAERPLL